MKDRREYIISKAMELYALQGFGQTSITDLQNALDMGRGTLYYYFSDQEELFQTCMERYFLQPKQAALQLPENVTMDEMIGAMERYLDSLQAALLQFEDKRVNTSNVNNLMFDAYTRFPSLRRKAQRLALKELDLWRRAINYGQRTGDIRRDIDAELTAIMFAHIKNSYDSGLTGAKMDFDLLKRTYHGLYKLIKAVQN
ncbi:MAG: TetR/AcrR family transcriptional regulator [Paludibacteraceae bacterium]|jgi:AcrR family transcriptional regulator|nr:TetR/AcrR family transcriptional regulator [Paludibacteraceae bacterium]